MRNGKLIKTYLLEIIISIVLAFAAICALFYFKVISLPSFIPALTFLPYKEQVYKNVDTKVVFNTNNLPEPRKAAKVKIESNQNPELDPGIVTIDFDTEIISIKNGGESNDNMYEIKVKSGAKPTTYSYNYSELLKIKVLEQTKNSTRNIDFSDLKAGDKIIMNYTLNFTTKSFIALTITRI